MKIGERIVGQDAAPFVIAEVSGNHNQSLDRALAIVDAAAAAGAHGLKLQTYTPDSMTLDLNEREFRVDDPGSLWFGRSLYELYGEACTPYEWHEPIFERARRHGLIPFSTPFDAASVEFLESLDVSCYKIASFENSDLALVRKAAATGKPLIISTGMATVSELDETVHAAREAGCQELVLLKCTSSYPALPISSNLRTIPHLRALFNCEVGLSDHTLGVGASVAAVALGATVIERHFTLARADGGVDSAFSLEPSELATLVVETERAWQAVGSVVYGPQSESERRALIFRRSLYFVRDVARGEEISEQDVRAIRPGLGLAPKHINDIVGRRVRDAVRRGTPVSWGLLS